MSLLYVVSLIVACARIEPDNYRVRIQRYILSLNNVYVGDMV